MLNTYTATPGDVAPREPAAARPEASPGSPERVRQLEKELNTLRKAVSILEAEFGVDPKQPREVGYAMCKGLQELQREYLMAGGKAHQDPYNPFWSDSRRH